MNYRFLANTLLGLALAAAGPLVQSKEKTQPIPGLPAYGKDKPLVLPDVKELKLENGLTLWLIERHDLPLVSLYLAVRGGVASDPKSLMGLSNILSATLTAGTEKRSSRQIAEDLQAVGAEIEAAVSKDMTYLGIEGLASGAGAILEILAETATQASFPREEVKLAIENELQSIVANRSEPTYELSQVFQHQLFGDHPYAFVNPRPEVIRKITRADLVKAYRQRFRPDQAILVMVGDLTAENMQALARKHFGHWKPAGEKIAEVPPAPREAHPALLLVDRPNSVQSSIFVGQPIPPTGNPDEFPLQVANTLFGGAFGSRLTMNIREDKGYTYSPHATVTDWAKGGMFRISASVRNEVTAATLVEIFYELDRLATTLPEMEELARTQRYLKGRFLLANEAAAAVAATLTGYWIDGKTPQDLAKYVPGIDAVKAADVEEMGRRYFASRQQTVAISGDAQQIREQLALFGDVKVVEPSQ